METEISLINSYGCKFEGSLSEEELKAFLDKGWKIADKNDKKAVANLVRFGV